MQAFFPSIPLDADKKSAKPARFSLALACTARFLFAQQYVLAQALAERLRLAHSNLTQDHKLLQERQISVMLIEQLSDKVCSFFFFATMCRGGQWCASQFCFCPTRAHS
jgi:hypothetical protein